ncbi:hypothetical protein BDV98DRAFT_346404 [Pterulicium gracile]|uniref:Uncharacterized protein n=1 Tax=Pterulicium gracile TaxID=1884261 RepID=A0A5C3Q4A4_9AGAR|nr:hypothetical protein BDV98DRAFT_346404 [Pterula gracilis]
MGRDGQFGDEMNERRNSARTRRPSCPDARVVGSSPHPSASAGSFPLPVLLSAPESRSASPRVNKNFAYCYPSSELFSPSTQRSFPLAGTSPFEVGIDGRWDSCIWWEGGSGGLLVRRSRRVDPVLWMARIGTLGHQPLELPPSSPRSSILSHPSPSTPSHPGPSTLPTRSIDSCPFPFIDFCPSPFIASFPSPFFPIYPIEHSSNMLPALVSLLSRLLLLLVLVCLLSPFPFDIAFSSAIASSLSSSASPSSSIAFILFYRLPPVLLLYCLLSLAFLPLFAFLLSPAFPSSLLYVPLHIPHPHLPLSQAHVHLFSILAPSSPS